MKLSIRIDFEGGRLGPGKVRLLKAIADTGSISGAGRALGMSYRRAWSLTSDLNAAFGEPLVSTSAGGSQGGGASVTEFGRRIISAYDELHAAASASAEAAFGTLPESARASAPPGVD